MEFQKKLDIYVDKTCGVIETFRDNVKSPWLRMPFHLFFTFPLMALFLLTAVIWDTYDQEAEWQNDLAESDTDPGTRGFPLHTDDLSEN